MLFNSPAFLLFLPLVLAAYWAMNRWTEERGGLRDQNLQLLIASYVFCGWWDWRFLGLIAFSTVVDYAVGLQIARANAADRPDDPDHRSRIAKRWLAVSLAVNLGLLGYFKYANFFNDNWIEAWGALGVSMRASSLQVTLPVGISFYTFQTLSYSIDVYRRKLEPTRDFIEFAAFVSFFPQLVAWPIERASALLPQIARRRTFDYDLAVIGLRLMQTAPTALMPLECKSPPFNLRGVPATDYGETYQRLTQWVTNNGFFDIIHKQWSHHESYTRELHVPTINLR